MTTGLRLKSWVRFLINFVICLALAWVLLAASAEAAPTTAEQARQVVANWILLEKQPLGARMSQQVKDIQTFADIGGPLYFVVYLEPAGLVFVPGDDLVEPIIGFASQAAVYDSSPGNPLGALVNRDIPGRVLLVRQLQLQSQLQRKEFAPSGPMQTAQRKWTMLQQGQSPRDLLDDGLESSLANINDVYVAELLQSKWNQGTVDNTAATPHCYDFFTHWGTPDTYYPCGCVATAMAQVMRKWQYPASPIVETFTVTVAGSPTYATIRGGDGSGGAYDWGSMELDPLNHGTTDAQRQAIGGLTYDAGAAVKMGYDTVANGGSGAFHANAAKALRSTFRYSNAKYYENDDYNLPRPILFNMVNANLDAGYPVLLGIKRSSGYHSIVGDGYGNQWGAWYHHLNMGWGGSQNLWYNLPNIDAANPPYNTVCDTVYNIYTSGAGEIISGRVTNSCGAPVPGVTVTASGPGSPPAVTTSASGIFAFPKVAANASYTIQVSGTGYTDQVVTTGESLDGTLGTGNRWGVNFVANRAPVTPEYVLYSLGGLDQKGSNAYAINNNGSIVGGMKVNNSYLNNNPCIWTVLKNGKFGFYRVGSDVVDYGEFLGINDNGDLAVGYAHKSTWPSGTQELPIYQDWFMSFGYLQVPSTPSPYGRAYGVNSSGQIVGNTSMESNDISACLWPNRTTMAQRIDNLGGTAGTTQTLANRINNAGKIVGKLYGGISTRAFFWDGANVNWLGPDTVNSEACSLNNLNPPTIVGLTGTRGYVGTRAVIFNGTAITGVE